MAYTGKQIAHSFTRGRTCLETSTKPVFVNSDGTIYNDDNSGARHLLRCPSGQARIRRRRYGLPLRHLQGFGVGFDHHCVAFTTGSTPYTVGPVLEGTGAAVLQPSTHQPQRSRRVIRVGIREINNAQPTAGDVHVNTPTNISVAYMQNRNDFIADFVLPNIPVQRQSDRYYVYDKRYWMKTEAEKRASVRPPLAPASSTISTLSYFADVFAVHKDVPDQIRANTDRPLDADRDATTLGDRRCFSSVRRNLRTRHQAGCLEHRG